jgi:pyridoxal phosphate enzyme (YggS family)
METSLSDTAEAERIARIGARLEEARARIEEVRREAPLAAPSVTIVAVSKGQPASRVHAALKAGHKVFAENRVQEAVAKWTEIRARHPEVELHLIGPLQTNKVREAVALFDVIETVDRPRLAAALAREMAARGRRPDCLVQVNTGNEPQKAGVAPEAADAFLESCRREHGLPVTGVMCIPPVDEEPSLHFALLRKIAQRHGLPVLSMGMSTDYETAVRFGATQVRIGTAIFGPRVSSTPSGAAPRPR